MIYGRKMLKVICNVRGHLNMKWSSVLPSASAADGTTTVAFASHAHVQTGETFPNTQVSRNISQAISDAGNHLPLLHGVKEDY